jgi:hypothetical protein
MLRARSELVLVALAGVAAGCLLGALGEPSPASAQETVAGQEARRGGIPSAPEPAAEVGRVWEVVEARINSGVEKAKYVMYNVRTGESYAFHNNGDRWVALPFVEGEAGAVSDSARCNLKHFGRTGAAFLPFSAVLDAQKAEQVEREGRRKAGAGR